MRNRRKSRGNMSRPSKLNKIKSDKTRGIFSPMHRVLLMVGVLAAFSSFSQPQEPAPGPQASPAQNVHPPAALPPHAVQPVAPDAPVITIHGICPRDQRTVPDKSNSCTVVLTRAQFENMVSSMNITNQPYTPPALRGFATGYATLLALAEAGEKEGVDKDPRFQELMQMARIRGLADSYRRHLQEKYGNPSPEEIEQYYKQNLNRFEQVRIERIQIPKVNPRRPQEQRPEFEKKARQLANELRERASKRSE